MNIIDIIAMLEDSGLSEIEELALDNEKCVLEFIYDFDKDEISAAKSYANEESDLEEESDEWRTDFYIPYLLDIAKDNVEAIIEETTDELQIVGISKELNIDANTLDYIKFVAAFCIDEYEGDIEEVLNDYN